jgi:hypothetical protein
MFPKTSCGLNYISKNFSCNLLDLNVKQSLQDNILYYLVIFLIDNTWQKYVGIDMIHMPCDHSNIFIITKLGIMNSQFYKILRLCKFKDFVISHMVNLIFLLKNKSYDLKILYRGIKFCLIKNIIFWDNFWKVGSFLEAYLIYLSNVLLFVLIWKIYLAWSHNIVLLIIHLVYIVLYRLVISQWVVLEV